MCIIAIFVAENLKIVVVSNPGHKCRASLLYSKTVLRNSDAHLCVITSLMALTFTGSDGTPLPKNMESVDDAVIQPKEENSTACDLPLISPMSEETGLSTALEQEQTESTNKVKAVKYVLPSPPTPPTGFSSLA